MVVAWMRTFGIAGVVASACNVTGWAAAMRLRGLEYLYTTQAQQQNGTATAAITFANGATAVVHPQVVVGLQAGVKPEKLAGKRLFRTMPAINLIVIDVGSAEEALRFSQSLKDDPQVRFAHPNLEYPVEGRGSEATFPDSEPLFIEQWHLHPSFLDMRPAWAHTRGNPNVIVGLLDIGFEQSHEDLQDAWLVNPKEIPNNRKDDDNNGLIDDVKGWNFAINGTNLIYGQNPKHGTATAGVIGARANGVGVAGMCPECKLLPIVVSGKASEDAAAILYAMQMGASVLSNSWGYRLDPPLTDAVSEALDFAAKEGRSGRGVPVVFAMHNAAVDDCREHALDISGHPAVIAVSSVDHDDRKVPNSGFGKCLAFVAPSSGSGLGGIATTDRAGSAGYNADGKDNFANLSYHQHFWGTSAATPQVSALFALLLSADPQMTSNQALQRMQHAAIKVHPGEAQYDPVSGRSATYGWGRISATNLFH